MIFRDFAENLNSPQNNPYREQKREKKRNYEKNGEKRVDICGENDIIRLYIIKEAGEINGT